jgi:hypothetical protein
LSGSYELSIQNDHLCFEKNKINLEISQNSNITDIKFEQNGYTFQYETNQDFEANLEDSNGLSKLITLAAKKNFVCVDKAGDYIIKPSECLQFKEKEFKFKAPSDRKLTLQPEKFLIEGRLKFESGKILKTQGINIFEKLKSKQ